MPEWETTSLYIADPGVWPVYCRKGSDVRTVFADLHNACRILGIDTQLLTAKDRPLDIWIRDWGFVAGRYFRYAPSYARGLYSRAAILAARRNLSLRAGFAFDHLPLNLDGGNFVHNGRVVVVTEKVLRDNPDLKRRDIERIVLSLGFEQIVFIPPEPEDIVGHADGILRFLPGGSLVVNDYHGTCFADYGRRLLRRLAKARLQVEVIPFPWFGAKERTDGIWSAVGVYINFVLSAFGAIVPVYGRRQDEEAVELIESLTGLPTVTVTACKLARLGGSLNCVTLNGHHQYCPPLERSGSVRTTLSRVALRAWVNATNLGCFTRIARSRPPKHPKERRF